MRRRRVSELFGPVSCGAAALLRARLDLKLAALGACSWPRSARPDRDDGVKHAAAPDAERDSRPSRRVSPAAEFDAIDAGGPSTD